MRRFGMIPSECSRNARTRSLELVLGVTRGHRGGRRNAAGDGLKEVVDVVGTRPLRAERGARTRNEHLRDRSEATGDLPSDG